MAKNKAKILLVDDEPDILEIVGYNLSQEGYQISTASNGKEAVAKAKSLFENMDDEAKSKLQKNILAGLPGSEETYSVADFLKVLEGYNGIDRKKLKEIHSVNPIDIVEGSELSFAFLPKSTSYKKVIRMHGGHHFFAITLNKKPALWRSFQELKSFKKADALIAVSNYVGETTKQLVKFNLQFEVIYNFIDLERFKKSDTDLKEENTIVFIGTVCEKKGVKQLVEAFPLIKKKFPNVKLYLVGRDWKSKEIDSYINYLKEMIGIEVKLSFLDLILIIMILFPFLTLKKLSFKVWEKRMLLTLLYQKTIRLN